MRSLTRRRHGATPQLAALNYWNTNCLPYFHNKRREPVWLPSHTRLHRYFMASAMDPTTRCNVYQWVILWIKWAANGMWNEAVPGLFDSRTPAPSALRSRQHKPSSLLIYVRACVCVRNGQSALRAVDTEGVKMLQDQSKLQIWQSPIIAKYHAPCISSVLSLSVHYWEW